MTNCPHCAAPIENLLSCAACTRLLAVADDASPFAIFALQPSFEVDARELRTMWRMLCARGKDLRVVVSDVDADAAGAGRAHWVAAYTYSATGRRVVNRIDATVRFRDGLIARHVDRFDLWRWATMALGAKGALLGWLPPVQSAIRAQAAKALAAYAQQKAR